MPSRKVLNSIANDIAHSFESRNNDLGGFWALGQIFSYAIGSNCVEVSFDLLSCSVSPGGTELQRTANKYSTMLKHQLAARSISGALVKAATISVVFDSASSNKSSINARFNENPFLIKVTIVDDRGVLHSREVSGSCYPHDPKRELQSTRVQNASNM